MKLSGERIESAFESVVAASTVVSSLAKARARIAYGTTATTMPQCANPLNIIPLSDLKGH
jgi:hypothetical protein